MFCVHRELGGCERSRRSFVRATYLTFWGQGFYFLVAALHTAIYASSGHAPLDRFPRPLQRAHAALYTSIIVLPFIATIAYWPWMFDDQMGSAFERWHNISMHGVNTAFALFEIVVPRTEPPNPRNSYVLVVVLVLYLNMVYLVGSSTGFYPYRFLDPSHTAGWKFMVLALVTSTVMISLCLIIYAVIAMRCHLTEVRARKLGQFARRDGGEIEMDEQVVG